jgi:hypothetical protein
MNEFMREIENFKNVELSESYRLVIREALVLYKSSIEVYEDAFNTNQKEYNEITCLEVDEILTILEEVEAL